MRSRIKKVAAGYYEGEGLTIRRNPLTRRWSLIQEASENASEQWLQDYSTYSEAKAGWAWNVAHKGDKDN